MFRDCGTLDEFNPHGKLPMDHNCLLRKENWPRELSALVVVGVRTQKYNWNMSSILHRVMNIAGVAQEYCTF